MYENLTCDQKSSSGYPTIDHDDSILSIHLQDPQILDSVLLITHVTRHLLSRVNTRTTTLTRTSGTKRTMRQRNTVTAILTTETMSLHNTRKALTLRIRPRINELSLLEPVRTDRLTNRQKPALILNPELIDMTLRRDAIGSEMAEQGLGQVTRTPPASTQLNSIVSMLLASLVRYDLDSIELQHGAGNTFAGLRVIQGGHALLEGDGTGPQGEGVCLALEGGGGCRFQHGQVMADVEARSLGGVQGPDTEGADRGDGELAAADGRRGWDLRCPDVRQGKLGKLPGHTGRHGEWR